MAEYTKAELDVMTDKATEVLRQASPSGLAATYADKVAGYLAIQFPNVPELPRIVLASAHMMSALGAEEVHGAVLVTILGGVGLRLQAEDQDHG